MKLVEAVINKLKLPEVRSALDDLGVDEFMESSVSCHSHGEQVRVFRGARFVASVTERVRLEIVSADDAAERIVEAIGSIARIGGAGECRIGIRPYHLVS